MRPTQGCLQSDISHRRGPAGGEGSDIVGPGKEKGWEVGSEQDVGVSRRSWVEAGTVWVTGAVYRLQPSCLALS